VKEIKESGKLTCGLFFEEHISHILQREYDVKIPIIKEF